jgi:hypothetical protein
MFRPARVFRELAERPARPSAWWRKPAFLLGALAFGFSVTATGRFTVRLVADGIVSFAFLPALGIGGLVVVAGRRPDARSFGDTIDLFFTGYGPWLVWLMVFATVNAIVPARELGHWIVALELSALVPAAWAAVVDFHFFRKVLRRTRTGAIGATVLHRLIGWIGLVVYFDGRGAWSEIAPRLAAWFGQ